MTDSDPNAKAPHQDAASTKQGAVSTKQGAASTKQGAASTKPAEIAPLIGKHLIYTYANGWRYEVYMKNEHTFDYRVHDGPAAGRWVNDQEVHVVCLADDVYKWSWQEPTGTIVSVAANLTTRILHGSAFFPAWIPRDWRKIAVHQDEHMDEMRQARDAGPTYPMLVVDEFAEITFVEDCGRDNPEVIACAPDQLPEGYAFRHN